jgi:hypothetical protein
MPLTQEKTLHTSVHVHVTYFLSCPTSGALACAHFVDSLKLAMSSMNHKYISGAYVAFDYG